MTETSAPPTGYQQFVSKMNDVLGNNFSPVVPGSTKRSGGLDPQCGLVIGLRPGDDIATELLGGELPPVWSRYDSTALHLTLGACEDRTTHDVLVPLADGRSMQQRYDRLTDALVLANGTDVTLTNPRILLSGDTIVLAGEPSVGLYEVRGQLTGAEAAQEAGVKAGWGAHITLARAKAQLVADERLDTNKWVAGLRLPQVIDFTQVIAAVFSVSDDAFQFGYHQVRELSAM